MKGAEPVLERTAYPALKDVVHLDVAAAFPLHERVIQRVVDDMKTHVGTPGKAAYAGSLEAYTCVEAARSTIASFVGADSDEIYFMSSTRHCIEVIATLWSGQTAQYCTDDHSGVNRAINDYFAITDTSSLRYAMSGEYDYDTVRDTGGVVVANYIHHIFGSENDIEHLRRQMKNSRFVVDASQAIAREPINVHQLGCDGLFFSSQKVGGLAGTTVLYIAKKYQVSRSHVEPNTLPVVVIESLAAAINILQEYGMLAVSRDLSLWHNQLVLKLLSLRSVNLLEQSAESQERCRGSGIVSFRVNGYTATDVMMILADNDIQVRGGDHCVMAGSDIQDSVRISGHVFSTYQDIEQLLRVLQSM